jgi:hypothetical protein
MVHALGIRVVGDEAFLARGNAHNEEGYWETPELVTMNQRLLAFLGGSWREVPPMPAGWERSWWLEPYRRRARALVAAIPGERRAWKDPRLTLTLPFWQRVVPEARYVLCFRNPLDVHRSLERREGMDVGEAVRLWGIYSAAALRETVGRPRLLLFYEDFFDPARRAVERLAAYLAVPPADVGVVHETLRHHAHGDADVFRHPAVDAREQALWEALVAYRDRPGPDTEAALDRLAATYPRSGSGTTTAARRWRYRGRWVGGTLKMLLREGIPAPT